MHRINPRKILYAALGVAVAMMTMPFAGAVVGSGDPGAVYAADMAMDEMPVRDVINKSDWATNFALGNLDLSTGENGYAISIGAGTYEGEQAIAAGIAFGVTDTFVIQGTAARTSEKDTGAGVSLNWKF